jgi:hypothetical protein
MGGSWTTWLYAIATGMSCTAQGMPDEDDIAHLGLMHFFFTLIQRFGLCCRKCLHTHTYDRT